MSIDVHEKGHDCLIELHGRPVPGASKASRCVAGCLLQWRATRDFRDITFLGPRIVDKLMLSLIIMTLYWRVRHFTARHVPFWPNRAHTINHAAGREHEPKQHYGMRRWA